MSVLERICAWDGCIQCWAEEMVAATNEQMETALEAGIRDEPMMKMVGVPEGMRWRRWCGLGVESPSSSPGLRSWSRMSAGSRLGETWGPDRTPLSDKAPPAARMGVPSINKLDRTALIDRCERGILRATWHD